MPQPRKRLVSTGVTPFYHVIARCVRRHFLCGVDPLTGKDYAARKQDIKERLSIKESAENNIPHSTTDYLELVDWSGRAIAEGKKAFIPEQLPPILQRLNMQPEQYLAYVRKPKSGFANALGALDKLKACAEHFEKAFLSPPYSPLCRSEGPTGPVVRAFWDRAQRKRTRPACRLQRGEDARPSETPWTRGTTAPQ